MLSIMVQQYDMIVIGAGSGGLNMAVFANTIGLKTLLIDKTDKNIGGDCLNYGCIPSKALLHIARLSHAARQSSKYGIKTSGNIDLAKANAYVTSKKEYIRKHENAAHFQNIGIDVVLGVASFVNRNTIAVNNVEYSAPKIILATGSRPRKLSIPGIEQVDYWTNETIFNATKLPKHLLVIGGGPIGIELGQSFLRMGSKVTVLQNTDQFLPKEEKSITDVLYAQLTKEGMQIICNAEPLQFTDAKKLEYTLKDGSTKTISFDNVLVSIGRQLNIDGLNMQKAGIELEEGGHTIKVDNYLRTTNKRVVAVGDVAGSYQFTHAAELHAKIVINNLLSPFKKKISYEHFSWVTYTSPQIATFGLNADILIKKGVWFKTLQHSFKEDDRAIVDGYTEGKMLLHVDKKGHLLGGSMIAEHAGEIFQELVLANSAGLTTKDIFNKVYAYPTASRVNRRIIMQDMGSKLTPRVKSIMRILYKILN